MSANRDRDDPAPAQSREPNVPWRTFDSCATGNGSPRFHRLENNMSQSLMRTGLFCGMVLLSASLAAQDLMVYPMKDQSKDQQEMDEFQCYGWARDRTGFDPMEVPRASSPQPEQQGGAVRGAAGGAAAGALVGAIAGDTKKGAAIGGALGGIRGGSKRAQSNREREQWEQQQAQQYAQRRNEYNRAYAACLEGRGYSVK
jgi:hypothetical protein